MTNNLNSQRKYEILESLPAYGPMYIPVTESGKPCYSEGFVIKFSKTDGTNWVANFKPGWTELNAVYEFQDLHNILVIAGGTCYIMNPDKEIPIETFGADFQAVIRTIDNRLILQNPTDLTIIQPNGEKWSTERISWDGIKDLKLKGEFVSGLSFNPLTDKGEWINFVDDLEKRNVKGGSYRQF